jgi:4-hydroxymandelate oxidase
VPIVFTSMPDFVPSVVTQYFAAGGDTGLTVELNRQAWKHWSLVPRVLRDVSAIDTAVDLLGIRMASPILVAPMSALGHAHPGGEAECAAGAAAAGVTFCLTSGSSQEVERVGRAAGPFLQQVYLWPDRERIRPFLNRAAQAGAVGLILTVDSPPQAAGYGFRGAVTDLPPVHSPHFPDGRPPSGSPADLTAEDLQWLRQASGLPVIVKGVLHPDDAVIAVEAGAAGVLVSNHGGRQIDGCLTTAEALPDIAGAVARRVPVLVDGGLRSADDIVRALALGADGVLLGRPVAWALGHAGAEGVRDLLARLRRDLVAQLALCGISSVRDVPAELVRWRAWG